MEAEDIEHYLAELGTELKNRGLKKPVRMFTFPNGKLMDLGMLETAIEDSDVA